MFFIFSVQNPAFSATDFVPIYSCKSIARIFTLKKDENGKPTMFIKSTKRSVKNIGNLSLAPSKSLKDYSSSHNFIHKVDDEKLEFNLNVIQTSESSAPDEWFTEFQYFTMKSKKNGYSSVNFFDKQHPENFGLDIDSIKLKNKNKSAAFQIRCKKVDTVRVNL